MCDSKNLEGQIFGDLTVLNLDHFKKYKKNGIPYWNCACSCGGSSVVSDKSLISGRIKSCKDANEGISILQSSTFLKIDYYIYNRGATLRNLDFNLSKVQFSSLVSGICYYCGEPYSKIKINYLGEKFLYNGIDRKNPSLGYSADNCVTCCKYCNRAKSDLTLNEFYKLIYDIHKNLGEN
jgi:hypothetical protein